MCAWEIIKRICACDLCFQYTAVLRTCNLHGHMVTWEALALLICVYSSHLSNHYSLSLVISLAILSQHSSLICLKPSSLHLSESSISSSSTHMCHSVIYHWLFIAYIMSWTSYILCTCKVYFCCFVCVSFSYGQSQALASVGLSIFMVFVCVTWLITNMGLLRLLLMMIETVVSYWSCELLY